MSEQKRSIEDRLKSRPDVLKRFESIINIIEDAGDDIRTANEAEERVIEELKVLGNEVLHDWAKGKESEKIREFISDNEKVEGHGKKKLNGIRRMEK